MAKQQPPKKANKVQSDDFISDEVAAGSGNGYMKFDTGANKFRAISKPIEGWEVWEEDEDGNRKPVRTQLADGEPEAPSDDPKDKPKKFLALAVIDRADDEVKILEITQKSVLKAIQGLARNPDWGNPFTYDINVSKKGEGMKTRYTVQPSPKSKLSKEDIKAARERPCNLEAFYDGENPWEVEDEVTEYFLK